MNAVNRGFVLKIDIELLTLPQFIMPTEKATIIFTLYFQNEGHIIRTYQGEYYSLMTLISAILPVSGFGLCCGMGSCGTCLIEISNKERSYKKPVLACSIAINDQLANTVVLIPDRGYY